MIKVEKLSYAFPDKELYKKVSFEIENGQHCAFIGSNGTGKTTFVEMIMDREKYLYDGKIVIEENCRIGYISQFVGHNKMINKTVYEYLSEEFVTMQTSINEICTQLETAEDFETLLEMYQQKLDAFNAVDGDNYDSNIKKMLKNAGMEKFTDIYIDKLSGGEFKLVRIAKEMMMVPELLIMDEPDVFLDFENLNSLMELINSYNGTLLVITHNRYILNHCFNKIIHLEDCDIQEYDGSYQDYKLDLLRTKAELQQMAAEDIEEIERTRKMVDKLRKTATAYASAANGRSLRAKVSQLERLEARQIKTPFLDIKSPDIKFKCNINQEEVAEQEDAEPSIAIDISDYSVTFEEEMLSNVSFQIKKGEKVALIGANGTGKTTLLRAIMDASREMEYVGTGNITIANNLKIMFLSQFQNELFNESESVELAFEKFGFETHDSVKEYLERYCFNEDILGCKISALSGGEKNMLQIAAIAACDVDILLLDEPTSHLDMYSQIALEKALAAYEGTVLMVSHDFYTVANCMDYVLEVGDKAVRRESIRKFRKDIYANHFDKDYIEMEQKRKETEEKINKALADNNCELANTLLDSLEEN